MPTMVRRPADRQITEDQKADFDKLVTRYQQAKKNGSLSAQDCSEIASAFKRLAEKVPALLEARNNEATVYLECNQKSDAVRIWEQMASGAKPYARALANLGYLAWQAGNKAEAEAKFNKALVADPLVGSIPARINLAQIYRERARTASGSEKRDLNDKAVKELRRVLALDGNSLQAYAGLCFIYFDLDLPEAAKLVGAQAIKRAQEIATGKFEDDGAVAESQQRNTRGGRRGRAAAAEEGERTAAAPEPVEGTGYTVEMKKALAVVYNTMGMIALSKKNYTEAIKNFSAAVDNDPTLYEARMNLAAISLKFRNYEVAEQNLRAVIAAQPKNYEAIIGLGVALRGEKKLDEAEAEYNRAKSLDGQRAEAYFNLGLLYQEYKAGSDKPMLQKAQQYYRDFISRTSAAKLRDDAKKRIKDIDEVFVALEEAAKMMKEAEELQRKAEEQQKKMEEELKRQQEAEKQQQDDAAAKKAGSVTPPPVQAPSAEKAVVPEGAAEQQEAATK
jgi:tetratricopeptide (TPR) repeat protein